MSVVPPSPETLPPPHTAYLGAMRARLPVGLGRLDDACAAFDAAITPLQRSRLVATLGIGPEEPPSHAWRARSPDAIVADLLATDRQALTELVVTHQQPAPRRQAHWLDRFAGLGVAAGRPGAIVVSPFAVAALARLLAPCESAAWDAVGGVAMAPAATLVSAEAAAEAALDAPLSAAAAAAVPRDLAVAIWRACAARAQSSAGHDEAVARLAGRARQHALATWHEPTAPEPPRALLANPNGRAPWWQHVQPGPLIASDATCAAVWFADACPMVDPETVVAALVTDDQHPRCRMLPMQHVTAEALFQALPRTGLRSNLALRDALVQPDALREGALSWADVLGLAHHPELGTAIGALLDEDVDWTDFDAVGEGELPRLWRDILRCSGVWDTAWAMRFEALLEEPALAPSEILAGYPCPSVARASRLSVDHSPMSSYVHGLNDGTAEAYGDVHAPSDPFSDR